MRLIAISIFITSVVIVGVAKDWRGLTPLSSTRNDVEQLFGPNKKGNIVTYDVKGDLVSIVYSSGTCGASPQSDWDVPVDTVIGIQISLKKAKKLSSLAFDLRAFDRIRGDNDLPNHNFYVNRNEGFQIEVQDFKDGRGELVTGYVYGPTLKDTALKCNR